MKKQKKNEDEFCGDLVRFTAKSMQELSHHLRGLIQLCKAKKACGWIMYSLQEIFTVFSFWRAGKKYSFRGDKTFIMLKKEKNNEYLC